MAHGNHGISARRALSSLTLLGASFGYVEAAVVVYLRSIYDPIRAAVYPNSPPGELFPLLKPENLPSTQLLMVELGREFATLVMLGAAALAVSRNWRTGVAAFGFIFGVWDIFFYLGLKVAINWPASLFTWDILFLLPGPWVGPVIAPVLVSAAMIWAGIVVFLRESRGRPVAVSRLCWTGVVGGGLVIIVSFLWDWRNTLAGGWPNPFNWPLFLAGLGTGLAAFLIALRETRGGN